MRLLSLWLSMSIIAAAAEQRRPVAIVTGGTRGIGSGIARELLASGYDLLLTYNTNQDAAERFAASILINNDKDTSTGDEHVDKKVECIGGDISLSETRDKIFECLDRKFPEQTLSVMVHNAGQYVGVTAENVDGIECGERNLVFGDGSLLTDDGTRTNLDVMHYYQRMYGDTFVDLCERSLHRMKEHGGSIIGISSPGVCSSLYGPGPSYSMPGSGKCIMEYSMRIFARQAGDRNVNVNVIVPGVVRTDAWDRLAKRRGIEDTEKFMQNVVARTPIKRVLDPSDIGKAVAFLCSDAGSFITGTVLPVDGGIHIRRHHGLQEHVHQN